MLVIWLKSHNFWKLTCFVIKWKNALLDKISAHQQEWARESWKGKKRQRKVREEQNFSLLFVVLVYIIKEVLVYSTEGVVSIGVIAFRGCFFWDLKTTVKTTTSFKGSLLLQIYGTSNLCCIVSSTINFVFVNLASCALPFVFFSFYILLLLLSLPLCDCKLKEEKKTTNWFHCCSWFNYNQQNVATA